MLFSVCSVWTLIVFARCTALFVELVVSLLKIPVEKKSVKKFQWKKNSVKVMIQEESWRLGIKIEKHLMSQKIKRSPKKCRVSRVPGNKTFFWPLETLFLHVKKSHLIRSGTSVIFSVKGLTSWLSFMVSNCEFVTFLLVSWVRCGT